jgi:hypothetical protein
MAMCAIKPAALATLAATPPGVVGLSFCSCEKNSPNKASTRKVGMSPEKSAEKRKSYELCDVGRKHNRVPMVCNGGRYNVLAPLTMCLTQDGGEQHWRNLACLSLVNLSILTENKHVMALGSADGAVLSRVLAEDDVPEEGHLCCIICRKIL